MRLRLGLLVVLGAATACSTPLPDPESAGAQVYRVRCGTCHRLYDPGSLTVAMWEVQLDRMQQEMVKRGVNPLTVQERHLVMSYMRAHASDGLPSSAPSPDAHPAE